MGKYDTAVRCTQIRNLIEQNQYLAAMEEIEMLNFEQIPSISDLYLFADIFLKAEKMDVAKELYYTAYRRTASRPALHRLLMLVIGMGDVEEARDLYLTYEIIAGMTLDTYELKYRLAKAEGEPYAKLIEILEELKSEEYTEEWGLQLAKLYELEGMREKCIEECEELERWFAIGPIVDKARELKQRCMSPDWVKPIEDEIPEVELLDPEVEPQTFAYAPAKVEEIVTEPEGEEEPENEAVEPEMELETEVMVETQESETIEEEAIEDVAEDIPEEELEEESEEALEVAEEETEEESEETAEDEAESEETAEDEAESEEEPAPAPKRGFLSRLANYFRVDLDEDFDEFPEELDTYKQQSTVELNVKAILAEGVDGIIEEEERQAEREALLTAKTVRVPVESLEAQLREMEDQRQVIRLDDTMDVEVPKEIKSHPLGKRENTVIQEDISPNGIRYNSLKGAIGRLQNEKGIVNFALVGGAEGISLAVAKKLFKELKKIQYFEAKNIGKISADKLEEVNLDEWAEKFIGGCMYILDAPQLSADSIAKLIKMMDQYQKQIVFILEGGYQEMEAFFSYNRAFEEKITYKIKL
nr:hypothetical protein [Eubacterium sp.]